jgi:hypothetical protein
LERGGLARLAAKMVGLWFVPAAELGATELDDWRDSRQVFAIVVVRLEDVGHDADVLLARVLGEHDTSIGQVVGLVPTIDFSSSFFVLREVLVYTIGWRAICYLAAGHVSLNV